jgi:hypothetical protein
VRADAVGQGVPADCSAPENFFEALWCRSTPPDRLTELPVIQAALARMQAIGGVCADLARTVDEMLIRRRVHVYSPDTISGLGGAAPVGLGVDSYLLLSRDFISHYPDAAHQSGNIDSRGVPRPQTLQLVLAHEADHILGADHMDLDGYLTPNSQRCSDLRCASDVIADSRHRRADFAARAAACRASAREAGPAVHGDRSRGNRSVREWRGSPYSPERSPPAASRSRHLPKPR